MKPHDCYKDCMECDPMIRAICWVAPLLKKLDPAGEDSLDPEETGILPEHPGYPDVHPVTGEPLEVPAGCHNCGQVPKGRDCGHPERKVGGPCFCYKPDTLPETPTLSSIARLLMSARSDIVVHGNHVAATSTLNLALDEIAKMEGGKQ